MSESTPNMVDGSCRSLGDAGSSRNGFRLEPRCRVCRNEDVRHKVNDLLAKGASYAMVARALEDDNAELDEHDRVTIDSIRNHCQRHFAVQSVAKATYREILERRAKEYGVDFVNGVATAITPIAFYEIVMARAYETLVDPDTEVDVKAGMVAAGQLHELTRKDAGTQRIAEIIAKQNLIIRAMQEVVPSQYHAAIISMIEGQAAPETIEAVVDDGVEEFDPGVEPDDDDFDS
jgi:hypothetical protein